jgi:hypothetical protein
MRARPRMARLLRIGPVKDRLCRFRGAFRNVSFIRVDIAVTHLPHRGA